MKRILLFTLIGLVLSANAQTADDPVLMTINGKPVTVSEFEYSYKKNGNVEGAVETKTVREYVPMFINYKLKVEAAEAARLDTAESFRKEFLAYRDMQLTPFIVDQNYIDSVAKALYDQTEEVLAGRDLLHPAHILIKVGQKDTEEQKTQAKEKIDSIYAALLAGDDFEALARKYSDDPGTARKGGVMPIIGPGSTVQAFEEVAYATPSGEISEPFLSPYGFHIIKMIDRKPMEPFDTLYPSIIASLKRQNIEERAAERQIKKIVDSSNGKKTRESVLDSVMYAQIKGNSDLKYLIQEYHDGLLLYDISKRDVWDVAAADTAGLEKWYKDHKKQYAWTAPKFKGFVIHLKDPALEKPVKKMLKKYGTGEWRRQLKREFNKDSASVNVSGPYLCAEGENQFVDAYAFKNGREAKRPSKYSTTTIYGKILKQPKSWLDVKMAVTNDYQNEMERVWVEDLRKRFSFTVNEEVLNTIADL